MSLNNELSYLDLQTSRAQSSARNSDTARVSLSTPKFNGMMSKLEALEKGLLKLNKLDKLDKIENNVKAINTKMSGFEERLSKTESLATDLQKSVEFVNSQYDVVTNVAEKLTSVEQSLSAVKGENVVLRKQ